MSQAYAFIAAKADRLDRVVAAGVPALTRSAAQRLIERGHVRVNGAPQDAAFAVKRGDAVEVEAPDPAPAKPAAEAIPLDVLYEDSDVLAVNKPAGMVVHPGAGNVGGTLVSAALHHAPEIEGVGEDDRPGIVHRLDKETSGVVLMAKTAGALRALQAQFKARDIRKTYLALCVGDVQPPRGVIDRPITRDPFHRQRMAVAPGGREAVTEYAVSDTYAVDGGARRYSLVRVHPLTGRTHQLRVHFASIGYPITGDALYGATRRDPLSRRMAPRHWLHAHELRFRLPSTGQTLTLIAPLPGDLVAVLAELVEG